MQKSKTELKQAKTAAKNVPAKASKAKATTDAPAVNTALNALLWLVAIVLVAGAIVGNWYYTQHVVIDESSFDRFIRVAIVIAVIVIGLGVTLFTNKGRSLLNFGRESYVELRKVVWPTRQEAMQTTFIVFVAVCVVSLFLYLCDVVFLQLVRYITL
ncbi:MAG: preprotein translocase subunit SecE [Candidatus Anaerobiospirillum merdipullorum]|uniref:Protein translocase subunit SecE n=1 Tax=Candidatus Anaerobiospirillum merdipullorum TaxID=2838450 RepID=A0A9E2KP76_9GAMM|nr:preprotein translocase subunit SecE [Candidatus Anaerobiospirillum merdipullorum]